MFGNLLFFTFWVKFSDKLGNLNQKLCFKKIKIFIEYEQGSMKAAGSQWRSVTRTIRSLYVTSKILLHKKSLLTINSLPTDIGGLAFECNVWNLFHGNTSIELEYFWVFTWLRGPSSTCGTVHELFEKY